MIRSLAVCVALIAIASGAAHAHDYWLLPDTFTPKPGNKAQVAVRLYVGAEFKADQEIAFNPKQLARFEVLSPKGKVAAADIKIATAGDKPAHYMPVVHAGTSVLQVDRNWSSIALKAEKFTAYLKEEGLDHIIAARAKSGQSDAEGKERYRRYLKSIVQAGGEPGSAATERLGQMLELIPGKNPYALKAGDELPVTLEFDGKPLVGAKVTAWHRESDSLTAVAATTDKAGKVTLKLPKSGTWIVRTVHMRAAAEDKLAPSADWESFWTSLTFSLP